MSEWVLRRLDECADFFSGGTPSKQKPEYWNGSIPWVSPKDMNTFKIMDAQDHVTPEGVEVGSRLIPENTILFVVRSMTLANRFQIAITRREVSFNQDLKALRCFDDVDPDFLFYSLLGHSHAILGMVDEATHGTKRLRTEAISSLEIPVSRRSRRAARDCPHPRRAGRQDRAKPPAERDARSDRAGDLQVVVRRFRSRPRQSERRAARRHGRGDRRAVPRLVRGQPARRDPCGMGGWTT